MVVAYFKVFAELEDNAGRRSSSKNLNQSTRFCLFPFSTELSLANALKTDERWKRWRWNLRNIHCPNNAYQNQARTCNLHHPWLSSITNSSLAADSPNLLGLYVCVCVCVEQSQTSHAASVKERRGVKKKENKVFQHGDDEPNWQIPEKPWKMHKINKSSCCASVSAIKP